MPIGQVIPHEQRIYTEVEMQQVLQQGCERKEEDGDSKQTASQPQPSPLCGLRQYRDTSHYKKQCSVRRDISMEKRTS